MKPYAYKKLSKQMKEPVVRLHKTSLKPNPALF